MTSDITAQLERIEKAKTPKDIFGSILGDALDIEYKGLLIDIHPDRFPLGSPFHDRAKEAVGKLADLYSQTQPKIVSVAIVGKWIIESPLAKGDIADLYRVVKQDGTKGIFKIVQSEADNDLMEREASAIKDITTKLGDSNFRKYYPKLLESFRASNRQVNVFEENPGYISLAEIKTKIGQIPFKHIVWMMNRITTFIGFSERSGYIHAGLTPDSLLFRPEYLGDATKDHGLKVVGWGSVVKIPEPISIVSNTWKQKDIYPPEIFKKWNSGAGTNIYMAAKSMKWAAKEIPNRFKDLFGWCEANSPTARPQDSWEFQDRWIKAAREEYGEPKYESLIMKGE